MEMTPALVQAIFAGITLLILWTSTVIGAVSWVAKRIKEAKNEILTDFDTKHQANLQTVEALKVLVIRHDTWLNPEFNGGHHNGRSHLRS